MVRHPVKQNISWWLSWLIPPGAAILGAVILQFESNNDLLDIDWLVRILGIVMIAASVIITWCLWSDGPKFKRKLELQPEDFEHWVPTERGLFVCHRGHGVYLTYQAKKILAAGKIDVVEFLNRKREYVSHVLKL